MKDKIIEILIRVGIPEMDSFEEAGFDINAIAQEIWDALFDYAHQGTCMMHLNHPCYGIDFTLVFNTEEEKQLEGQGYQILDATKIAKQLWEEYEQTEEFRDWDDGVGGLDFYTWLEWLDEQEDK